MGFLDHRGFIFVPREVSPTLGFARGMALGGRIRSSPFLVSSSESRTSLTDRFGAWRRWFIV